MLDYKKIMKSRSLRLRVLKLFSWIPDSAMLRIQYRIKTGHRLNLTAPKRFTEKLQWYKLYYKNPLLIKCVDKGDVRDYVKSKGLATILIPCYGVFDTYDEIKWNDLPNQFVIKDTLGGGGASVVLVKDKSQMDFETIKARLQRWTSLDPHKKGSGREWPYYNGKKHRIIIEKYMESEIKDEGLTDYKFFCFNGKCEFLYVMGNRNVGQSVNVSIYDRDFNLLPVLRVGDRPFSAAKKPSNYDELLHVAEILSKDFPHVRVDLYDIDNAIYFGELTFFNASGYMKYEPDSFDYEIGNKLELREYKEV